MEKIRDLLDINKNNLKVRENKGKGNLTIKHKFLF